MCNYIYCRMAFKGLIKGPRNLIRDPRVVPGGGASEMAASLAVLAAADKEQTMDQP